MLGIIFRPILPKIVPKISKLLFFTVFDAIFSGFLTRVHQIRSEFLELRDEQEKISLLDEKLPELSKLMEKMLLNVTESSKIDLISALLHGDCDLISNIKTDIFLSIEDEIKNGVFEAGRVPVVGNFVASSVESTRREGQSLVNKRPQFTKNAKWYTHGRLEKMKKVNLYDVKSPLMEGIREMCVNRMVPDFLQNVDKKVARCYEPVHSGCFMNFLSSFVGNNVCPDAVRDTDNQLSSLVIEGSDGVLSYRSAGHICWSKLYLTFNPRKLICNPLRDHTNMMVQFVTSFKYMLYLFDITSSEKVSELLATRSPVSLTGRLKTCISKFSNFWRNGVNYAFLPSCGCTNNRNTTDCLISLVNGEESGLCYHSKIEAPILQKYAKLFVFLNKVRQIADFPAFGGVQNPHYFKPLLKFETCPCMDCLGHCEINLHNLGFRKNAVLPAHMVSSRVLQNVVFEQDVLDKSLVGDFVGKYEIKRRSDSHLYV